jgi:hypothetical protein
VDEPRYHYHKTARFHKVELGNSTIPGKSGRLHLGANIKPTGLYFHPGGDAALRHVVEFCVRGGNFPATHFADLDVDIDGIPGMDTPMADPLEAAAAEERIQAPVAFLSRVLTDERLKFERAPFDHPELQLPAGARGLTAGKDAMMRIPAVGRNGRTTEIPRFLGLDPQAPWHDNEISL